MKSVHGAYAVIDVTTGVLRREQIPTRWQRCVIGGVGLGTTILRREMNPRVDPLAAESVLVLALSPLVGTALTTSAKFAVVGKSPLTGRLNDSLSSSRFALTAKRLGVDALAITGRAPTWSVIVIDDSQVSVLPADRWLGLSAADTEASLRQELRSEFDVITMGPAGERQVRYATLSHAGRHAGRGGMGAVLGSKRIKAIAVRGSMTCEVADPVGCARLAKDLSARSFGPATAKYRELGTVANLLTFNRLQLLPTRNFQASHFEQAEALSGEALATMTGKVRDSCTACTIGCEHLFPSGPDGKLVRLEYESQFALGPMIGLGDPTAMLTLVRQCDEVGIDTISFGGTFAFGCECVERGLLAPPTDVDLRFGSVAGIRQAIDLVSRQEGTGRWLAQGSRAWAESIGPAALAIAPQVKGLELPGYDPRRLPWMALGLTVGTRGADHNRSGAYEVDFQRRLGFDQLDVADVVAAIETEDRATLLDSLILCKFLRGVFTDIYAESAELLQVTTGLDYSADELRQIAKDLQRQKRQFNEESGWTCAEDVLPARFFEGENAIDPEVFGQMIAAYYQHRGLDAQGRLPTEAADRRWS